MEMASFAEISIHHPNRALRNRDGRDMYWQVERHSDQLEIESVDANMDNNSVSLSGRTTNTSPQIVLRMRER